MTITDYTTQRIDTYFYNIVNKDSNTTADLVLDFSS